MIAAWVFWTAMSLVLYTYLLYPLLVFLIAGIRRRGKEPAPAATEPSVSVVIALHNEAEVLPGKLENLRSLRYPETKIEFILGSDGSSDGSEEILRGVEGGTLTVRSFNERRGKVPVINDLVRTATGDIIVFSDANTMYEPDAVTHLIRPFADPSVGAVCGELRLTSDGTTSGGAGEDSYWRYECRLKEGESSLRSLLGATGGIYAVRRSLWDPLPEGRVVTDDLLTPLRIVRKGYRVVYEPGARAVENASNSVAGEFRRKLRIAASNFHTIADFRDLLSPRWGWIAFGLWSHKIVRWFVPFLLLAILASLPVLAGDSLGYDLLFDGAVVFLLLAAAGFVAERLDLRIGKAGLPYYFTAMNAALLMGFIKFLRRSQRPVWEIVR